MSWGWEEWAKGGGIMAAGAAITKAMDFVWSNKRRDQRNAVKDYQTLLDLMKREREECLERVEKVEAKLGDCEERHDKMEGRFDELRDEVLRKYLEPERKE